MRLKNQFQTVVAGLVVVVILSAGAAIAAVPSNIEVASTPKITLQVTDTVDQVEGTMISGKVSPHFVGRGPSPSTFAVQLDHQVPTDGRAVVTFSR